MDNLTRREEVNLHEAIQKSFPKCHILFLRKRNKPNESLVTIEVRNNHIVQARRRFNDDVTAEDQKAIDAFNKKFANKEDKAA